MMIWMQKETEVLKQEWNKKPSKAFSVMNCLLQAIKTGKIHQLSLPKMQQSSWSSSERKALEAQMGDSSWSPDRGCHFGWVIDAEWGGRRRVGHSLCVHAPGTGSCPAVPPELVLGNADAPSQPLLCVGRHFFNLMISLSVSNASGALQFLIPAPLPPVQPSLQSQALNFSLCSGAAEEGKDRSGAELLPQLFWKKMGRFLIRAVVSARPSCSPRSSWGTRSDKGDTDGIQQRGTGNAHQCCSLPAGFHQVWRLWQTLSPWMCSAGNHHRYEELGARARTLQLCKTQKNTVNSNQHPQVWASFKKIF